MAQVIASIAGNVRVILSKPGDEVSIGQDIIVLESMKLEIPIFSELKGIVKEIKVNPGDFVNEGDVLVEID
jgi:acetyl-CoA carboxylase biotin carboxyl carrier protein